MTNQSNIGRRRTSKGESKEQRKPAERDADSTRLKILTSALEEFSEKGFEGARIDTIAQSAGVNKQAIYYHFDSKDGLFAATLTSVYSEITESSLQDIDNGPVSDELNPATDEMSKLVGKIFDDFARIGHSFTLIVDENRMKGRHLAAGLDKEIQAATMPMRRAVSTALERGQASGVFRQDIDAGQLYVSLVSLCQMYILNVHTLSAVVGLDLSAKDVVTTRRKHVVDLIVRGIRS